MRKIVIYSFCLLFVLLSQCKKEEVIVEDCEQPSSKPYVPTYYQLDIPSQFPQMALPADNPLTVEGIELGRYLFYEKKLSGDNTMSCASCHSPELGFSDDNQFSTGIDGIQGNRQAMPLINLGYAQKYFWDGRANSLYEQAFAPVTDPIEMHDTWPNAVAKLQADTLYPDMFYKAFGTYTIDSTLVSKAITQFELTLISGNSKYDKFLRFEGTLSPEEFRGFDLFRTEGGDCFHCHDNMMTTDHSFQNNGLNPTHTDLGLGAITGNSSDNGKFKVPTLRNIALTAPYMHDGRFNTLDEVIDFYSSGVHGSSPNISAGMVFANDGGVNLTPQEKSDLKAFLLTLTDSSFINNPDFSDPFE